MHNILGLILGGGQGKRLYPLTKYRSKPAVPLGGKYRLIDIPISNCINSGIYKIFVLTQFNSASLNRHISLSYKFDNFRQGFVDFLAAEQTVENTDWFQGTADAVRKNMRHFPRYNTSHYLILSGDHIYRMDFKDLFCHHQAHNADITIAVTPVERRLVSQYGILKMDTETKIVDFKEKPRDNLVIDRLKSPKKIITEFGVKATEKQYFASTGIYLFNPQALDEALADRKLTDFGGEVIPKCLNRMKVYGYIFRDYWEDIGTIESFYRANLDLINLNPPFDFFSRENPIYTNARFLPGSKILGLQMKQSIICEGCVIDRAIINHSVIGLRSIIREGAVIEDTYLMGADYFQTPAKLEEDHKLGIPNVGVGKNSYISRAIIDKNARIGENVRIKPHPPGENFSGPGFTVINGITVVEKDAVIADGMEI